MTVSYGWLTSSSVSLSLYWVFAFSWTRFQLPVLIFHTSSTSHTCSSLLASFFSSASSSSSSFSLTSPPLPPGRSGLAASYLSVKALVPQMPKLLKSLFPARDDKKELRPSPHNQQVSRDDVAEYSGRCLTVRM